MRASWAVIVGLASSGLLAFACATGTPKEGPCDPASCKPGNECLSDGVTTECRLVCASPDGCPVNFACKANPAAAKPFCTADALTVATNPGIWGAHCNPRNGFDDNADCDLSQGFHCQASSPTDGNAYCSRFCDTDSQCRSGWYCGRVNKAPNAIEAKRSDGETWTVCMPRSYCASCESDLDCPKTKEGSVQHCVANDSGAKMCAPECQDDANCPLDANCATADEIQGGSVCKPRAGTCKGDGTLCSPCNADGDCVNGGLCVIAGYSTERFCSAPAAGGSCAAADPDGGASPCSRPAAPSVPVGCVTARDNPLVPQNHCVGLVQFGTDSEGQPVMNIGCWTRPRQ